MKIVINFNQLLKKNLFFSAKKKAKIKYFIMSEKFPK